MMTLPKMTSDIHRVGGGFSVQFDTRDGIFRCEWMPTMPSLRDLRRKVSMKKYEAARNLFLAELQQRMGVPVTVVTVEGGGDVE